MSRRIILLCAAVLIIAAASFFGYLETKKNQAIRDFETQVARKNDPFQKTLEAYRTLLKKIGPSRGQDVLRATMPNDSRTHMINHETGTFLYTTYGPTGMTRCKQYFAGGCFHGFVEAHIAEYGYDDISTLVATCKDATKTEQEMQCPHGVGHAFLIAADYPHLPDALNLCADAFADDRKSRVNCFDGVFMENSFGPFSVPPADRWYRSSDPMYPCMEPEVLAHDGAHTYCWGMQSQATLRADAFPAFAGNAEKVGAYCETLTSAPDKKLCFEGLARQLQLRDPHDSMARAKACATLTEERRNPCVWQAYEAAYIYGSRDEDVMHMCVDAPAHEKEHCYDIFFEGIAIAYSQQTAREAACATLPEFRDTCIAWMQGPRSQNF